MIYYTKNNLIKIRLFKLFLIVKIYLKWVWMIKFKSYFGQR